MPVIRYILIGLLVYLIVRSFTRQGTNAAKNNDKKENTIKFSGKKVSKSIGEYIDYEEVENK